MIAVRRTYHITWLAAFAVVIALLIGIGSITINTIAAPAAKENEYVLIYTSPSTEVTKIASSTEENTTIFEDDWSATDLSSLPGYSTAGTIIEMSGISVRVSSSEIDALVARFNDLPQSQREEGVETEDSHTNLTLEYMLKQVLSSEVSITYLDGSNVTNANRGDLENELSLQDQQIISTWQQSLFPDLDLQFAVIEVTVNE